jgi:RHS repeat-associated protein
MYGFICLGSTSVTATSSGSLHSRQLYKPWGEVRYSSGSLPTKYTYTGQYSNVSEFGLLFYNARWVDPLLGRFTSPDSIVPIASQGVQAWDRYAYVNNNPVKYTDPSGHDVGCGGRDASTCGNRNWQRDNILAVNQSLYQQVESGSIDDLEAFATLVDYAASFSPNNSENFINDLGAVLTGLSEGSYAKNEIKAQFYKYDYDERYKQASTLGQSGFAEIFQDPGAGGNQPHHYWFYVQVGHESGRMVSNLGVIAHETILTKNRAGNSFQDVFLGFEGTQLGSSLKTGTLSPTQTGNYIRTTLSPASDRAKYWEALYDRIAQ